jgi:hypothetical protein
MISHKQIEPRSVVNLLVTMRSEGIDRSPYMGMSRSLHLGFSATRNGCKVSL